MVSAEPLRAGVRVAVRRRLADGSASDVVGTLVAAGPEALVVRTSHGPVRVPVGDVVAARVVPPRASRRGPAHLALSVRDLEDVMADGWRALETAWLGGPGGWLLRASEGFTGRGNSALPLSALPDQHGAPHRAALDLVRQWYAERGLPATVVLAEPVPPRSGDDPLAAAEPPVPGLRAALEAAGWVERNPTLVLVAATRAVAVPVDLPAGLAVDVADTPDAGWLSLYRYRGQELPRVATSLLVSAPRQEFVSLRDGDETVAVGRVAVSRGWGGVTAMQVASSHRRRGLARAVLALLARRSLLMSAPSLYLQVARENEPARALYGAAGFTEHHGYSYWSPRG
jgi:N-acetylglutamate synthase